jgi:hypothetical protein
MNQDRRTSLHKVAGAFIVLALLRDLGSMAEDPPARSPVEVRTERLRTLVADNTAFAPRHRAGYSGIAELYHGGSERSLFVPAYAGLNFEHIFSGDAATFAWSIFEPREAPMEIRRPSDRKVELRQERTAHWPLRTTIVYEIGADAIDMTVRCVPLEDAWRKHGYIGLFFASYIDAPEDGAIHFIGRSRPGKGDATRRWIRHLPESHGDAACHRPAGSDWDPPLDSGFKIPLAAGASDLEYVEPFYYGVSHGKCLVMMFDAFDPATKSELRFAQSPSGGGKGNPAWDFLFLPRGYEVGKEFAFRARAVVLDYTRREQAVTAYESWAGRKVALPTR